MWTRRRFVASSAAATVARRSFLHSEQVPFIDAHVHVWNNDSAFPFAPGANRPAQDAPAEMILELMRANGVARTVI